MTRKPRNRETDTPFEVLFCAEPGYYRHAAVAAISLAENNRRLPTNIHVLASAEDTAAEDMLRESLAPYGHVNLAFYQVSDPRLDEVFFDRHLTKEAYMRFLAPEILPASVARVLYLDCDVVVLDDLTPLWNTDLRGKAIAAAPDFPWDENQGNRIWASSATPTPSPSSSGLSRGSAVHPTAVADNGLLRTPHGQDSGQSQQILGTSPRMTTGQARRTFEPSRLHMRSPRDENGRLARRLASLGLGAGHTYVNSGVLILDLDRWRHDELSGRLFAYAKARGSALAFHDQDTINAVLRDDIHGIDCRWNLQARMYKLGRRAFPSEFAATRHARQQPAILHYTTDDKPWLFRSGAPRKKHYFRYLRKTAWRNARPAPLTIPQRVEWWLGRQFLRVGIDYMQIISFARYAVSRGCRLLRCDRAALWERALPKRRPDSEPSS